MPFLKVHKTPRWKIQEEKTLKHGLRHAVFSSNGNSVYVGEWGRNKKSGKGIQIDKKKWVYEGDWLNGLRHGYGVLSYQDEDGIRVIKYEGDWKFGKADGFGTHHYYDGSLYEGDWVNGERSGEGRMWYVNKTFYEGQWLNDKRHGKGLCVYPNGNRYEGHWQLGIKDGHGTYYHLDSGQKQTGVWLDDVPVVSKMEDILFRQAALQPTEHPIPELELDDWERIYNITKQSAIHKCEIRATFLKREAEIKQHPLQKVISNTGSGKKSSGFI